MGNGFRVCGLSVVRPGINTSLVRPGINTEPSKGHYKDYSLLRGS